MLQLQMLKPTVFYRKITWVFHVFAGDSGDVPAPEKEALHPFPFKKGDNGRECAFFSSIIGNFMVIKIALKQIYCSYLRAQKIQNVFV